LFWCNHNSFFVLWEECNVSLLIPRWAFAIGTSSSGKI